MFGAGVLCSEDGSELIPTAASVIGNHERHEKGTIEHFCDSSVSSVSSVVKTPALPSIRI